MVVIGIKKVKAQKNFKKTEASLICFLCSGKSTSIRYSFFSENTQPNEARY
jgi:hypothetical protein